MDHILNKKDIDLNVLEIKNWYKKQSENAIKKDEKCTILELVPVMGKRFEYDYTPINFKHSILNIYNNIFQNFNEVTHVKKYVMDKIYFSKPKYVKCVSSEEPWAQEAKKQTGIYMYIKLYLFLVESMSKSLNFFWSIPYIY